MNAFPDPFTPYFSTVSPGWAQSMSNTSQELYAFLFFIQLCILGGQAALSKDSVVEFIGKFASKVILGSVIIAALANANVIFPELVSIIAGFGNTTANNAPAQLPAACVQNRRWTCVPPTPAHAGDVEGIFLGWGVAYFLAADGSRIADAVEASASGFDVGIPFPPDPGDGATGPEISGLPAAFLNGHAQFQIVCEGLGMICVLSAGLIYMTYILLNFEAQIVLAIGCFTLAGYGWKFTEQYSKAFPTYCFTIATKFFAFYFVVSAVYIMAAHQNDLSNNGGVAAMIAGMVAAAAVPFGAGAIVLLFGTSSAPVVAIISSILVASVPQLAASMTKGGSALSAMGGLSSAMGHFKKH
jgi:hypothetical protein